MILKGIIIGLIAVFIATTSWGGTITGVVKLYGKSRKEAAVHLEGVKAPISPPEKGAVMIQKGQLFIPRVLPVVKGTTVFLPNKDTVIHSAFSLSSGNAFNLGSYSPGKNPEVKFESPGKVDIFCNMHEQMHALVLVLEHPYFTLTAKKGKYTLSDVPDGTYRIKAWVGPRWSEEKMVTVSGSDVVEVDFEINPE